MNIVHMNLTDLTGRRFNGFDLHLRQIEQGHKACCIVDTKKSDDATTFPHNGDTVIWEWHKPTHSGYALTENLISSSQFLQADIVHLHLTYNILFELRCLPLITMLKPVVWTLHDPWLLCGGCIHPGTCEKWRRQCFDCENPLRPFSLANDVPALAFEVKRSAVQGSHIEFIVASKWMREHTRQSPIVTGKMVHLVPFGVNHELFHPGDKRKARADLGVEASDIVFLARSSSAFKRQDIVQSALANLNLGDRRATLLLVGQKGLLKLDSNGITVKKFGWVDDDDLLATMYKACDLLLMPSDNEAFGLLAVEAMSCGKMVLALDSPGSALPEVINAPECGMAVAEETYGAELQRLINNPGEIKERGERSLVFARERYDHDRYLQHLYDVYGQVRSRFVLSDNGRLILEQMKKRGAPSVDALPDLEHFAPKSMVYVVKKRTD